MMRTALRFRKQIGKQGAEGMLNEETICSRPTRRLKIKPRASIPLDPFLESR